MAGTNAGSNVNFASAVSDFVRKSDARMLAVFRTSVERVVDEMQTPVAAGGNMPVDTGFLRASLQMSLNVPVPIDAKARPADGRAYAYDGGPVAVLMLGAELGDTVYASYTASYAAIVHYGNEERPGRQWVTMAAMKWPAIVTAACNELQTVVEGK